MNLFHPFLPTKSNPNRFAPREVFLWYLMEARRVAELAGEDPIRLELEFWREELDLTGAQYVDHRLMGAVATLADGRAVDLKAQLEKRAKDHNGGIGHEEATLFGRALLPEVFESPGDILNEFFALFGYDPSVPRETIVLHVAPGATDRNLPEPEPEHGFLPLGPVGHVRWKDYVGAWHALANATRELAPSATRVTVQVALEEDAGGPNRGVRYGRLHRWRAVLEGGEEGTVEIDLLEKVRANRTRFEGYLETTDFHFAGFWFGCALRSGPSPDRAGANLYHAAQLLTRGGATCRPQASFVLDLGSPPELKVG